MSNANSKATRRIKVPAQPQTVQELEALNRITADRVALQQALREAENNGYRRGVAVCEKQRDQEAQFCRLRAMECVKHDILGLILVFFLWLGLTIAALMLESADILHFILSDLVRGLATVAALVSAGWLSCDLARNK